MARGAAGMSRFFDHLPRDHLNWRIESMAIAVSIERSIGNRWPPSIYANRSGCAVPSTLSISRVP